MDCRIKSGNDDGEARGIPKYANVLPDKTCEAARCSEKTLYGKATPYLQTVIPWLDHGIHSVSYQRMTRRFWVYILATRKDGTLYTGVTNDLLRRLHEHQSNTGSQFTRRHSVKRLVWYEEHPTAPQAIAREKAIKTWPRAWKIELIEAMNPDWYDLGRSLNG